MKRKAYELPMMQVVKLRHKTHLLQASGTVNATMNDTWTEETI